MLTNDIVSFEQLGSGLYSVCEQFTSVYSSIKSTKMKFIPVILYTKNKQFILFNILKQTIYHCFFFFFFFLFLVFVCPCEEKLLIESMSIAIPESCVSITAEEASVSPVCSSVFTPVKCDRTEKEKKTLLNLS